MVKKWLNNTLVILVCFANYSYAVVKPVLFIYFNPVQTYFEM